MSDLTTRLLVNGVEDRAEAMALMEEAVARIEALEADLAARDLTIEQHGAELVRRGDSLDAGLAVIAEALALHTEQEGRTPQCEVCLTAVWPCETVQALSRVPQGAAERAAELWPRSADLDEEGARIVARANFVAGATWQAEQAAARGVAPDRDPAKIAQAFHEAYERLAPTFGYQTRDASAVAWESVPEQNKTLMVATVADLLASDVLGIPFDQRTADRETIAQALHNFEQDIEPVSLSQHAQRYYGLADAVLAVLVPADHHKAAGA